MRGPVAVPSVCRAEKQNIKITRRTKNNAPILETNSFPSIPVTEAKSHFKC